MKFLNKPSRLGLLSTTTFSMVQFFLIALYPAIAESLHLKISEVVLAFTLGSLCFIWSSPFWAKLSDEMGRQRVLSFGLNGLTVSFIFLSLLVYFSVPTQKSFLWLLSSRIIYGLTASAIVSVTQAWWRDQKGDVTKNMLNHSLGLNLGRLLAPLIIIATGTHLMPLLWSMVVWTFLLSSLAFFLSFSSNRTNRNVPKEESRDLSLPLIMAFVATAFLGIIHSTLSSRIQTSLGLSIDETAVLCSKVLLASSALVLLIQIFLKRFESLRGKYLIWTGVLFWLGSSYFFSEMKSQASLWIAISLISIGLATITPGYLSLLGAGGRASGFMGSTQTLGLTLGGALGYTILEGFTPLGTCLFGLTFILLVLSFQKRALC